jgi:hypothetical protein
MWGTNDPTAFATLTYGTDTNWTLLNTDINQFAQHITGDVADPQYFKVNNAKAYRYYAFKIANNWGDASLLGIRRLALSGGDTIYSQYHIICNKATAMTVNLPPATGSGRHYYIKNVGAGVVTVDGNASETIDGATTKTISQFESLEIIDYANGVWGIYKGVPIFGDATNYTKFDTTGHQTMAGNARPWRDELTDALNIRSIGSGVSINNTESTVDFATNAQIANDYLYCNIQLNHDKDLTSIISPHIHFFQSQNNMPNFMIQYRWQTNDGAKVTSWTSLKINTPAITYVSGTIMQISNGADITPPAGTGLSDIVQFRICRDTDNDSGLFTGADPYTTTVGILAFDVHFMINSLGSDTEYTK